MAKKRRRKRSGAATSALSAISTSVLQAEIAARRSRMGELRSMETELSQSLAAVQGEIAALNGVAAPARRGRPPGSKNKANRGVPSKTGRTRPKNKMNLEEALVKLLTGRTMAVKDIVGAVQKEIGYKTNAANFRTIVNQALTRSKAFKKISRGRYTAA